jgi:hypothetical protein
LQLARIFVVFLAVGMPCLLVWAALGSGAGRLLHSPACAARIQHRHGAAACRIACAGVD